MLRSDVDPRDVIRVIHGIWYLPSDPEWREDVGRMLDLVIDGLRYGVPGRTQQPARYRLRVCSRRVRLNINSLASCSWPSMQPAQTTWTSGDRPPGLWPSRSRPSPADLSLSNRSCQAGSGLATGQTRT